MKKQNAILALCSLCVLWAFPVQAQVPTFQRQLDSLNGIFCLEQSSEGNYWLGTFLGRIIRLDSDGQWLGAYALQKGDTASCRFIYDLERAPNGDMYALYDRTNRNFALDDYLILARLSPDGQPIWQTAVHYGDVLHWAHNRMVADPAGNVYVMSIRSDFSVPGVTNPNHLVLVKMGPDGSLIWSKEYDNGFVNYPRALVRLDDGGLLIAGNAQQGSGYGFVLRLDAGGNVLFSKRYARLLFKSVIALPDGSWFLAATEQGPLPQAACLLRMDVQGNIIWCERLQMPSALNWIPALVYGPDGLIWVGNYESPSDIASADLFAVDINGAPVWAKRYDLCHNYGVSALIQTLDGGVAGLRFRPGGHIILKTDAEGNGLSCPSVDVALETAGFTDTPLPLSWQSQSLSLLPPVNCDFTPFSVAIRDYCENEPVTDGIEILPEPICTGAPASFSATGSGLADSYQWSLPGASPAGAYSRYVDPVYFTQAGTATAWLYTRDGFCRDTFSADFEVFQGPDPVDLGPDTTLCGHGASITLHAWASGAAGYHWSDGPTDSVRIVDSPGIYAVEAYQGSCRTLDTISVQIVELPQVDLPSDTIICGADTIWLDVATPSAERYVWNDGIEGSRRPLTESGVYVVTVYQDRCAVSDLISVDIFPTPPAFNAETRVCEGAAAELDVGGSVAGQIWWNGIPGTARFTTLDSGWVRREIRYRGCYFSDSTYVHFVPCKNGFSFYAPSVFNPETGGENAFFNLFGPELEVLDLQIFDRWGGLLFEDAGPNATWDGRVRAGSAPPGVYVWMARVRQGVHTGWVGGDVLLIR